MDISAIDNALSSKMNEVSQNLETTMKSTDPSDPTSMYKIQVALNQYSVFNGLMSAFAKNLKDLAMGIISKI